jgi:predicted phage-related endonuclease
MSKEYDNINQIIIELENINKEINTLIKALIARNKALQDEVDSLWIMMDEMAESDIKNYTKLFEDLEKDMIIKTLMMSKKKVLA